MRAARTWSQALGDLRLAILIPVALLGIGTAGYVTLEGWSAFDALYMTVITLGTVGYGETHALSTAGRAFTMVLILGGVFSIFYFGAVGVRFVLDGELVGLWRRRKMQRLMDDLSDHVIVCGYGRLGQRVTRELAERGVPFVAIDHRPDVLEAAAAAGGVPLHGDATSDEVLERAGLRRARALVAALASDADNLYVTMSARLAAERLNVVARAESVEAEAKLLRAGASRVISPYVVSGHRAAQAILRPEVMDFVDVATGTQHLELGIEQVQLGAGSPLVGKSLASARVRQELGVIVVALKRVDGPMSYNPPADEALRSGDVLIALGAPAQLRALDELARAPK